MKPSYCIGSDLLKASQAQPTQRLQLGFSLSLTSSVLRNIRMAGQTFQCSDVEAPIPSSSELFRDGRSHPRQLQNAYMPRKRKRSSKQSSWLCSLQERRTAQEFRSEFERSVRARTQTQAREDEVHFGETENDNLSNAHFGMSSSDLNVSPETEVVQSPTRDAELHEMAEKDALSVAPSQEGKESSRDMKLLDAEGTSAEFLVEEEELSQEMQITPFEAFEEYIPEADIMEGSISNGLGTAENSVLPEVTESTERREIGPLRDAVQHYNESDMISELRRWENPYELLSLVMVTGSVRFAVQQYEVVRCLPLAGVGPEEEGEMSSYNAVRLLHRRLQKNIYPKSVTVDFNASQNEPQSIENGGEEQEEAESEAVRTSGVADICTSQVRVVLPTSWAKQDVATPATYRFLFESEEPAGMHVRSIENADIVRNRHRVTCPGRYIHVDTDSGPTQVSAGATIKVYVSGLVPSLVHGYRTVQDPNLLSNNVTGRHYSIESEIAEIWYVGSENDTSVSGKEALRNRGLSEQEKSLIRCLSQSSFQGSGRSENSSTHLILPGDQCVLLRCAIDREEEVSFAVLVHRFWKDKDGIPSTIILWGELEQEGGSTNISVRRKQVVISTEAVLQSLPLPSISHGASEVHDVSTRNQGALEDGTPYVVYRILLYCDDFNPSSSLYPRGSAGGCYMLPIGLPPEARRSTSAVRVISLTPPGISTNSILHFIVEDLVNGTVIGVDGVSPDGTAVKIFLDVVGFIGDYPASAHAVDLLGHISRSPCTHCIFRKLEKRTVGKAKNGYTTKIHACNSASIRCGERQKALRESNLPDRDANRLGMKPSGRVADYNAPLLYLHKRLEEKRHEIPLNDRGELVVSGLFDAYRCNVVAPDHLLSGLAINVMDALFTAMPSDYLDIADCHIIYALKENGLLKQKQVYNPRTQKMNSMSLSSVFCVFTVSAQIMDIVFHSICSNGENNCLLKLLIGAGKSLQRLITYTYWWPTKELDGEEAVQLLSGTGRHSYYKELQNMAAAYVEEIDDICSKYPESSGFLDKPNLHRLLELYYHSVPTYGHAREFSELVFEHAHQPLKRCISRSNHNKSQIFAVDHCVANDWQGRLASLHNELSSQEEKVQNLAKKGLRRLILGPCSSYAEEAGREEIRNKADGTISLLFNKGLLRMFKEHSLVSHFAAPAYTTWRASRKVVKPVITGWLKEQETSDGLIKYAVQELRMHHPVFAGDELTNLEVEFRSEARRTSVQLHNESITTPLGGHEVLRTGCTVQARVSRQSLEERHSILSTDSTFPVAIFAVVAIAVAKKSGEGPWALVTKCKIFKDRGLMIREPLGKGAVQWLQLSESMRRIGLYHDCRTPNSNGRKCAADLRSRTVNHSGTLLSGARMRYQTRRQGYPPRMG